MQCKWYFSIIGISVLSFVAQLWFYQDSDVEKVRKHYDLVVGVLSSRDHFLQRKILREGFRKQKVNKSVLIKFIISNKQCHIPKENRLNPYSCESDEYLKPVNDNFLSHEVLEIPAQNRLYIPSGPIGFDFEVQHEIMITELGLFDNNQDGFVDILKAVLYDTVAQKAIIAASFVSFSSGKLVGNYRYKSVRQCILPKGFRGSIIVDGSSVNDPMFTDDMCHYNNAGGMIKFYKGYRYGYESDEFPRYFNDHIKSPCYLNGVSFKFSSYNSSIDMDASELSRDRSILYDDWNHYIIDEDKLLFDEQNVYNDLVFVPTVDSYRNLPNKMLNFYQWLSESVQFQFFMKTDDDCYVNIPAVYQFLVDMSKHNQMDHIWIGSFREYFPLDLHGKWREHDYKSSTYPPFACGSGYILSQDIIRWIAKSREYLKTYQGEDTSLGIWLASLRVNRHHDERFQCFHTMRRDVFTSPENNLNQLHQMYNMTDDT